VELIFLPYKAILQVEAIFITLYRMFISKKHLLEWVTAADAENLLGKNLKCYLKEMIISPVIGILLVGITIIFHSEFLITSIALFIAWTLAPFISYCISETKENKKLQIKENEKEILMDVAKRTWQYFNEYMNKENNFLPPDNYQESRKRKITKNTSSTNIGLRITCYYNCQRFWLYNQ
jgi:hypothetical protein